MWRLVEGGGCAALFLLFVCIRVWVFRISLLARRIENMKVKRETPKRLCDIEIRLKSLIDGILECSIDSLQELLEKHIGFWAYKKHDLFYWADVLDRFDGIFERILLEQGVDCGFEGCRVVRSSDTGTVSLLVSILKFSHMILRNCSSRYIYGSVDRLEAFLLSDSSELVVQTLCVLHLLTSTSRLSTRWRALFSKALKLKLNILSHGWGGRQNNVLSLKKCCFCDEKSVAEMSVVNYSYFADDCSDFEGQFGDKQVNGSHRGRNCVKFPFQREDGLGAIEVYRHIVQNNQIAKKELVPLFWHIRQVTSFANVEERMELLKIRLMAISVMARSQPEYDSMTSILLSEPDIILELVEILEVESGISMEFKSYVIYCLSSLSTDRSRLNTILNACGASLSHGLLPSLIRKCIQGLEAENEVEKSSLSSDFVSRLLSFVFYIATNTFGWNALTSAGVVQILLPAFECRREQYYPYMSKVLKIFEILAHNSTASVEAMSEGDVVTKLVLRLGWEADVHYGKFSLLNTAEDHYYAHERQILMKTILKFLYPLVQMRTFSDTSRSLMEGTLPKTLLLIIKNPEMYGPMVFASCSQFISNYIHHEPTSLSIIQEKGLASAMLKATTENILASPEVVGPLPHFLSALCLNEEGLKAFIECSPFEKLFSIFSDVKFLNCLQGETSSLGLSCEELIRHHPSIKSSCIEACVNVLHCLISLGQKPGVLISTGSDRRLNLLEKKGLVSIQDVEKMNKNEIPLLDFINNFSKFLETFLNNSEHCQSFVEKGGLDALLDLYSLRELPLLFCQSSSAYAVCLAFRALASASSPPVLAGIYKRLDKLFKELEWVLKRKKSEPFIFANGAPNDLERFKRSIVAVNSFVVLLVYLSKDNQYYRMHASAFISEWIADLGSEICEKIGSLYSILTKELCIYEYSKGEVAKSSSENMEITVTMYLLNSIYLLYNSILRMFFGARRRPLNNGPIQQDLAAVKGVAKSLCGQIEYADFKNPMKVDFAYFGRVIEQLSQYLFDEKTGLCNVVLLYSFNEHGGVDSLLNSFGDILNCYVTGGEGSDIVMGNGDLKGKRPIVELSSGPSTSPETACLKKLLTLFSKLFSSQSITKSPQYSLLDLNADVFLESKSKMFLTKLLANVNSDNFCKFSNEVIDALLLAVCRCVKMKNEEKNKVIPVTSSEKEEPKPEPVNEAYLTMLMDMGFSRRRAEIALRAVSNDISLATEYCISIRDDDPEEESGEEAGEQLDGVENGDLETGSEDPDTSELEKALELSVELNKEHEDVEQLPKDPERALQELCESFYGIIKSVWEQLDYSHSALVFRLSELFSLFLSSDERKFKDFLKLLQTDIVSCMSKYVACAKTEAPHRPYLQCIYSKLRLYSLLVIECSNKDISYESNFGEVEKNMVSFLECLEYSLDNEPGNEDVMDCVCATIVQIDMQVQSYVTSILKEEAREEDSSSSEEILLEKKHSILSSRCSFPFSDVCCQRLLKFCANILKGDYGSEISHAVFLLIFRLTRNFDLASYFLRIEGMSVMLNLSGKSYFNGLNALVSLIMRHILDDEATLLSLMKKEIGTFVKTSSNRQFVELSSFMKKIPYAAIREPAVFRKAIVEGGQLSGSTAMDKMAHAHYYVLKDIEKKKKNDPLPVNHVLVNYMLDTLYTAYREDGVIGLGKDAKRLFTVASVMYFLTEIVSAYPELFSVIVNHEAISTSHGKWKALDFITESLLVSRTKEKGNAHIDMVIATGAKALLVTVRDVQKTETKKSFLSKMKDYLLGYASVENIVERYTKIQAVCGVLSTILSGKSSRSGDLYGHKGMDKSSVEISKLLNELKFVPLFAQLLDGVGMDHPLSPVFVNSVLKPMDMLLNQKSDQGEKRKDSRKTRINSGRRGFTESGENIVEQVDEFEHGENVDDMADVDEDEEDTGAFDGMDLDDNDSSDVEETVEIVTNAPLTDSERNNVLEALRNRDGNEDGDIPRNVVEVVEGSDISSMFDSDSDGEGAVDEEDEEDAQAAEENIEQILREVDEGMREVDEMPFIEEDDDGEMDEDESGDDEDMDEDMDEEDDMDEDDDDDIEDQFRTLDEDQFQDEFEDGAVVVRNRDEFRGGQFDFNELLESRTVPIEDDNGMRILEIRLPNRGPHSMRFFNDMNDFRSSAARVTAGIRHPMMMRPAPGMEPNTQTRNRDASSSSTSMWPVPDISSNGSSETPRGVSPAEEPSMSTAGASSGSQNVNETLANYISQNPLLYGSQQTNLSSANGAGERTQAHMLDRWAPQDLSRSWEAGVADNSRILFRNISTGTFVAHRINTMNRWGEERKLLFGVDVAVPDMKLMKPALNDLVLEAIEEDKKAKEEMKKRKEEESGKEQETKATDGASDILPIDDEGGCNEVEGVDMASEGECARTEDDVDAMSVSEAHPESDGARQEADSSAIATELEQGCVVDNQHINEASEEIVESTVEAVCSSAEDNNIEEENPEGSAERSAAGETSYVMEGIDPAFLEALPEDLRREVIAQQFAQRPSSSTGVNSGVSAPTMVNPEFLAALPPEIQQEIVQQQEIEQRYSENGNINGQEMDNASFLASLTPELRREILLDQDDNFLSTLPPSINAEAQSLRERAMNQHQSSHNRMPDAYSRRAFSRYGYPRNRRKSSKLGDSKHEANKDGPLLLEGPALTSIMRIMFISEPLVKRHYHRLLLNLCPNMKTREYILQALISILVGLSENKFEIMNGGLVYTPSLNVSSCALNIAIARRTFEILVYLVGFVTQAPLYFLKEVNNQQLRNTWSELLSGKATSKASKGKQKRRSLLSETWLVVLINLTESNLIRENRSLLESLLQVIQTVSRPLKEWDANSVDTSTMVESVVEKLDMDETENAANPQIDGTRVSESGEDNRSENETSEQIKEQSSMKNATDKSNKAVDEAPECPVIPEGSLGALVGAMISTSCSETSFKYILETLSKLASVPQNHLCIFGKLLEVCNYLAAQVTESLKVLLKDLQKQGEHGLVRSSELNSLNSLSSTNSSQHRFLKLLSALVKLMLQDHKTYKGCQGSDIPYVSSIHSLMKLSPIWGYLL